MDIMGSEKGPPVQRIISENGKTYFYLNPNAPTPEKAPSMSPKAANDDEKLRQLIQLVEPIKGQLRFSEENTETPKEADTPLLSGEHMIVRNAREMFENVDILSDGRYFCRVCNRTYKTHATLTAHLRGCHLRQESPCLEKGCNYVSYTEHQRRKHQKMHDKTKAKEYMISCNRRDMNEYNYLQLPYAQQEFQHKMKQSIKHLPFPGEQVLREQILRHNKDIPGMSKSLDGSERGRVKYSCVECDQTFWNSYHASRHAEVHRNAPKRCYYCGEIRKGIMDLRVHYMRSHKNEGVRTFTCCTCDRAFTSIQLFEKHVDPQECEHGFACQSLEMRQDIYYGELPVGVTIDQKTLNRLNFFRKRHNAREEIEQLSDPDSEPVQMPPEDVTPAPTEPDSDIFDESNSLIQTEFGLKKLADYKMSSQFRTRSVKRVIDSVEEEGDAPAVNTKKERVLMAQNGYYELQESQSQQQNVAAQYSIGYIHTPPSYGFDPLIGTYPDFLNQPPNYIDSDSQQFPTYMEHDYGQQEYFDQTGRVYEVSNSINNMTPMLDSSSKDNMVNELLVGDGNTDAVFEELDKLDFAMPPTNENDCDDDLTDFFNF